MKRCVGCSLAMLAGLLLLPAQAEQLIFLEIPGIDGESDTLGHPDVIQVNSYSLMANDFSIVKPIDSTSAALFQATLQGTVFPTASLLFYNTADLQVPPGSSLVFQTVMATSFQSVGESDHVSFSFVSVPEPSALAALTLIACLAPRRRSYGAALKN